MPDDMLIPESRSRQAQARRNRLLEQSMRHLATIQRMTMREKKNDLDALTAATTKLAASITQVVRLHYQIWQDDHRSGDVLTTALHLIEDETRETGTEETR